jgi:peptidoglycan hydrolase CwlO-like protein
MSILDTMNSPRPYDPNKNEKCSNSNSLNNSKNNLMNLNKELLEKDEKIKDLAEKNDKLERECLKFQIQMKKLEDKLAVKQEKEYNVIY